MVVSSDALPKTRLRAVGIPVVLGAIDSAEIFCDWGFMRLPLLMLLTWLFECGVGSYGSCGTARSFNPVPTPSRVGHSVRWCSLSHLDTAVNTCGQTGYLRHRYP